jgi:hypothetical protein
LKLAKLCICRPFIPTEKTDCLDCTFYFVDSEFIDPISVLEVCKAYGEIYIEEYIYMLIKEEIKDISFKIKEIDNIVTEMSVGRKKMRVAFLASSDTHVQFMQQLAKKFDEYLYLIPARHCKDDAAAQALIKEGEEFIEIDYKADTCDALLDFHPCFVFCSADWTSEYLALRRIVRETDIKIIALQEGPQDWHFRIWQNGRLKVLNHYRNADIIFSTGAKTLNYIRPKYFAVTGNPKVSAMTDKEWPERPKVLINCNFTYIKTKPPYEGKRNLWMESVLKVCKKLGIDYIISKHPRDLSAWEKEPIINSNAYLIRNQIENCSICISRFSSILYETLCMGRESVYYNIHLEPMPTFQDEKDSIIPYATEEEKLEEILREHMTTYPSRPNQQVAEMYLNRHMSKLDGRVNDRILNCMAMLGKHTVGNIDELKENVGYRKEIELPEEKRLLETKRNAAILFETPNISKGEYEQWIDFAEILADHQWKVFLILHKYSEEFTTKMYYQEHQRIEVILTREYQIDFCGIKMNHLFIAKEIMQIDKYRDSINTVISNAEEVTIVEDIDEVKISE